MLFLNIIIYSWKKVSFFSSAHCKHPASRKVADNFQINIPSVIICMTLGTICSYLGKALTIEKILIIFLFPLTAKKCKPLFLPSVFCFVLF